MWVFTKHGFISIVTTKKKKKFAIRARNKDHLVALLPDVKIIETTDSDYRFRCILTAKEFSTFWEELQKTITYQNFKNEVTNHLYHTALIDVWVVMAEYQSEQMYFG